jgi:hypothetical protein
MSNPVCRINSSLSYDLGADLTGPTTTVQLGESSLAQVAARLQVDPASLAEANPQIQDPDNLFVFQEINIPQVQCTAPKPDPDVVPVSADPASKTPAAPGDPLAASAMKAGLQGKIANNVKGGDFVELYPIVPDSENRLDTHVETKVRSFFDLDIERTMVGTRHLNAAGLKDYLSEANGGRPLTDFEKSLAEGWSKQDGGTVLTPIVQIGSEGVKGYKLVTGGSGDRVTTIYDRNGHKLHESHYEAPLESEGLGPIDYAFAGMAAKGLLGKLFGKLLGKRGAAVIAESLAEEEAEQAASSTSASTGTATPPAEPTILKDPPAVEPTVDGAGPYRTPPETTPPATPDPEPDPWSIVERLPPRK